MQLRHLHASRGVAYQDLPRYLGLSVIPSSLGPTGKDRIQKKRLVKLEIVDLDAKYAIP